jgi:activating signal cointegrator 1
VKAITLTPPWSSLIARGLKRIETREWRPDYRGPILIHAAKNAPGWAQEMAEDWWECGLIDRWDRLPKGALVAAAVLVDCHKTEEVAKRLILTAEEREFGDFSPGRWAWVLTDVIPLPHPIPWRGALNLWECECEEVLVWLDGQSWPPPEEDPDAGRESSGALGPDAESLWGDGRGGFGDGRPGDGDGPAVGGDAAAAGDGRPETDRKPGADDVPAISGGVDLQPVPGGGDGGVNPRSGQRHDHVTPGGRIYPAGEPRDGRADDHRGGGAGQGAAGLVTAEAVEQARTRYIWANNDVQRALMEQDKEGRNAINIAAVARAMVKREAAGNHWQELARRYQEQEERAREQRQTV